MRAPFLTLYYNGGMKEGDYMKSYLVENIEKIMENEERGFISNEAVSKIEEFLDLKGLNIDQLRGKRNDVVMIMSSFMKLLDEEKDLHRIYKLSDSLSAVTAVIDNKIFRLGGEV